MAQPLLPATTGIAIATGATALAFPPAAGASGYVATWLGTYDTGTIPEFDLEVWCATTTAVNLTATHLYGATPHPFTIAATDINSVANASDAFTETAHGWLTGDGPIRVTTSGTLPAGLALATDYWIITIDANTVKLASSLANALAGTVVNITTDGTGTLTFTGTATTQRLAWSDIGLIGQLSDGAIALTASKGYADRYRHRPRVVAYALSATLSASSINAAIYPVRDVR